METNTAENLTREHMPLPTTRDERGKEIAKMGGIRQVGTRYKVPSVSGAGAYVVDLVEERCSCPDWELRRQPCKHVAAVYYSFVVEADMDASGALTETVTIKKVTKPCQRRDWRTINASSTNEGIYVERLLRALCDGIEEPPRKPGRGRKPIPRKDQAFIALKKVYSLKSLRRAQSSHADSVGKGYLDQLFNFNVASNFLDDEASTDVLMKLLEESAKPLANIEGGCFAIDSTGFSTVNVDCWFSHKHQRVESKGEWVKLHLICGTKTHVITAAKITDKDRNDSPELPGLLEQTAKNFSVETFCGDKAYISDRNLETIESHGAVPYIPFKSNVRLEMDPKRPVWSRHLFEFMFNNERFLNHYHQRSQVETVMQMLKSKFGASLRSRNRTAQWNETLAKCVLHNLCCIVNAIFAVGLEPNFWPDAATKNAGRPALSLVP